MLAVIKYQTVSGTAEVDSTISVAFEPLGYPSTAYLLGGTLKVIFNISGARHASKSLAYCV